MRFPGRSSECSTQAKVGFRGNLLTDSKDESGAVLVEFALTVVMLLTMVFGIMQASLAAYAFHLVSDAARAGARYAIVRGATCMAAGVSCTTSAAQIQAYVRSLPYPGINSSSMSVTTRYSAFPAAVSCSPSLACNNPGDLVTVTVAYPFGMNVPFLPSKTLTMTSSSAMVISQ